MKRRKFIQQASLGSTALLAPITLPKFKQEDKLKVGLIGAGWYGMVITEAALAVGGVQVMAVCDVDADHLTESIDKIEEIQGQRPVAFTDYKELLNVDGLDAIFIGTQPHWHALQFIDACKKGLHIYCEKPLSYDIEEGRAMVAAAERAGNIVQIGFQRRQSEAFKEVKKYIESGEAGEIHQVEAHIHYNPGPQDTTIQAPPPALDWESWCGPAPKLDYRPNIGHKAWRLEKEYGNGHLVDWGIHHIDIIRTIMNLGMPTSIEAMGGLNVLKGKITTPDTLDVTFLFDEFPVRWHHRLWGTGNLDKGYNNGVTFFGEKATLFASDTRLHIMKNGKGEELEKLEIPTEGMREKHMADFILAASSNDRSMISCPIQDAFRSTATVQLAMISYNTSSRLTWDEANHSIIDNKEASALMARPYRDNYQRPELI